MKTIVKKSKSPSRVKPKAPKKSKSPFRLKPKAPKKSKSPFRVKPKPPKKSKSPSRVKPKPPKKSKSPSRVQPKAPKKSKSPSRVQPKAPKKSKSPSPVKPKAPKKSIQKSRSPVRIHLEKGRLRKYDYSIKNSEESRHLSLERASNEYGALSVFRKLNALATLNKNRNLELHTKFKNDRDWVKTHLMRSK